MTEKTLAIIKPDAVANQLTGAVISMIEKHGFNIEVMVKAGLPEEMYEEFYAEHQGKPFFKNMVDIMASGPVVIMILDKENAVADFRKLIGATNPADAAEGTIRKLYGKSIDHNVIHGSDSVASAEREIEILFGGISEEDLECDFEEEDETGD